MFSPGDSHGQRSQTGYGPWDRKNPPAQAGYEGPIPGSGRRKWQSPPVFLPGKSHGQRSLSGYSPQGCKRVRHDLVTKRPPPGFTDNFHITRWDKKNLQKTKFSAWIKLVSVGLHTGLQDKGANSKSLNLQPQTQRGRHGQPRFSSLQGSYAEGMIVPAGSRMEWWLQPGS